MHPARLVAPEPHRLHKALLETLDHAHHHHTLHSHQQQASTPRLCTHSTRSWSPAWNGSTILPFSVATLGKPYYRRSVSSPHSEHTHTDRSPNHFGQSASRASSASPNAHATGVSLATKKLSWRRTNLPSLLPLSATTFLYMLYHITPQ
jgi:hypothetical protein